MKKEIIVLCAVAAITALAGCSPQGGTGRDRSGTSGGYSTNAPEESTTITNRDTNAPSTNRFGTTPGGSSSDQGQKEPGGTGTTPQGSGNQ